MWFRFFGYEIAIDLALVNITNKGKYMFKFNIYKKEIELLCEVLEKNNLTEIEIKNGNKSIKLSKNKEYYQATFINTVKDFK